MKKIVSIILALAMALALLCAAASADEVPQPEGGKKFESNWAIFNTTVRIVYEEEGYRVYIRMTDPTEHTGTEWEYACFYVEDRDALVSVSSSKNPFTENTATGEIVRGEYEYQELDDADQCAVFTINEDGFLTWTTGRGDEGMDLVFSDIGKFEGAWRSEDKKTEALIEWTDTEEDEGFGYNVYLRDEGEESYAEYSGHGLYDAKTGKMTAIADSLIISRLNAEGKYDMEDVPVNPDEPLELIFSDLGNGRILLEKENGIELVYDELGGDSNG